MKSIVVIFSCLIILSCNRQPSKNLSKVPRNIKPQRGKLKTFKPYYLAEGYLVIDTGEFENGPMGGTYAIVRNRQNIVDTISLGYGIERVAPGIFFYELLTMSKYDFEASDKRKNFLFLNLSDYVITDKNIKKRLKDIAPNFDNYFSSPSVINGNIYYWQHTKSDSIGKEKIFASKLDLATRQTKSIYLYDDDMGTDDSGYFLDPYLKNDTIYYYGGDDKIKKFSVDFKPYN
ncbi:hypothetical protein [Mucilaginibacter ginkgonis]|uniref:Uncharacterized protein n=1 Tax=Mucilaginibacter ginkgonis TaxID=2682091 RepID=A0A6I4HVR5_9SPHI|nr:hypothetical protein [Mucilaginibacter ginkgonis]QQL51034.1 hypothetical protein GO620_006175 [Mucilaginibacter ginkgonis]